MYKKDAIEVLRILFINFNIGSTVGINNGLAILSAVLKSKNHKVDLLFLSEELGYDFNLDRMKQDIMGINPDIIGISLMEPQFKYMREFCSNTKEYFKGFIVCGGPYPSMDPESILAVEGVNAVCIGEGEDAICELAYALESGGDYSCIKNLWVKMNGGIIKKNRLRPFIDLHVLPPEDKGIFDLDKILPLKNYQLETMLGRGCVYKCSYCINDTYIKRYEELCDEPAGFKQYSRMKSIDTVIEEIKGVVSRFPQVKKIAFIDDNFLMYHNFMKDFYRRYKDEVGIPFMCNINPMSFDYEKGKFLKFAGCDDLRFGIESGSERIKSEIMKRPISNARVIEAFRISSELGVMSSSFNMIGLPTETHGEVLETLRLNASILPDSIKIMTFYPFKNTPIYEMCEEHNMIDYSRKEELDGFDAFSCLKFPLEHQLFLEKIQAVFNWYINVLLNNQASSQYAKLIETIEKMDKNEWREYDFMAVDKKMSHKFREEGILHYTKYMNRTLGVKFPSKHYGPNGFIQYVK